MPSSFSLIVPAENAGERIDVFLASQIKQASRSQIRRAIESGDITVSKCAVKPSYSVRAGEEIQVELPSPAPLEAAPEPIPLAIIYEDEEIIVIDKPAGMVTHPGAGATSGTLANALVYHFNQISHQPPRRGGASRPGIVHRLDVGTSGLIVVAKTDRAHIHLAGQFASRTVVKCYQALVYGSMKEQEGRIDLPVGRDPRGRVKMAVRPEEGGRPALTIYQVRERFEEFTRLDVEIKTGRTHQIRVHLAHLKHPVAGDVTYGGGREKTIRNAQARAAIAKLGRTFLHAAHLTIVHPTKNMEMSFRSPLPRELQSFLEILRKVDS
ncbi:MAG: RluA family pseudouridine synthase [Blastocatellia bacterium]|nr:RluA family pseudouridine synthase [Blastocatellia bacterium]